MHLADVVHELEWPVVGPSASAVESVKVSAMDLGLVDSQPHYPRSLAVVVVVTAEVQTAWVRSPVGLPELAVAVQVA